MLQTITKAENNWILLPSVRLVQKTPLLNMYKRIRCLRGDRKFWKTYEEVKLESLSTSESVENALSKLQGNEPIATLVLGTGTSESVQGSRRLGATDDWTYEKVASPFRPTTRKSSGDCTTTMRRRDVGAVTVCEI